MVKRDFLLKQTFILVYKNEEIDFTKKKCFMQKE